MQRWRMGVLLGSGSQGPVFGENAGVALYPKRSFSGKEKKIVYRSFILVNPYQLWDESLVRRFWNIQGE